MATLTNNRAFDEGFTARQCGEPRSANPYVLWTEDYRQWAAAWDWLDEHLTDRRACLVDEGLGELVGGK